MTIIHCNNKCCWTIPPDRQSECLDLTNIYILSQHVLNNLPSLPTFPDTVLFEPVVSFLFFFCLEFLPRLWLFSTGAHLVVSVGLSWLSSRGRHPQHIQDLRLKSKSTSLWPNMSQMSFHGEAGLHVMLNHTWSLAKSVCHRYLCTGHASVTGTYAQVIIMLVSLVPMHRSW